MHLPITPDWNVYRDLKYQVRLEERILSKKFDRKKTKIIGYSENLTRFADYFYTWTHFNGINFLHTGADCLYICSHIMQYDKIYLVGYDYNAEGKAVHYYANDDPLSDYYFNDNNRDIFRRALFRNGPHDFNRCEWPDTIINCNPKSKLTKFKFLGEKCKLDVKKRQ